MAAHRKLDQSRDDLCADGLRKRVASNHRAGLAVGRSALSRSGSRFVESSALFALRIVPFVMDRVSLGG